MATTQLPIEGVFERETGALVGFAADSGGEVVLDVEAAQKQVSGQTWADGPNGGVDVDFGSNGGFWPDLAGGADMWRFKGRLMAGSAADTTGNRFGTQGSWLADGNIGANWGPRDSQAVVMSTNGLIALMGASKSSMQNNVPKECIGVAGFVLHDSSASIDVKAWALYGDVQHEATAVGPSYGLELAVKNKGANTFFTPAGGGVGTFGIWLQGGGDATYGGNAANPCTAAIAVIPGGSTWNAGLVFKSGALSLTKVGNTEGVAIAMAPRHRVEWIQSNGNPAATITSTNTAGTAVKMTFEGNGLRLAEETYGGSHFLFALAATASSAANGLQFLSAATGGVPRVATFGTDADIDLFLSPKGTGVLRFGAFTSNSDAAVNGYITIKDSAGNLRKLATIA